jgi:hypothetical protein
MSEQQILQQAANLLMRAGHTTLGTAITGLATNWMSDTSSDSDSDDVISNIPLSLLPRKKQRASKTPKYKSQVNPPIIPVPSAETIDSNRLDTFFQDATSLFATIMNTKLQVTTSDKIKLVVSASCTIRLRETSVYFIGSAVTGVNSDQQDLVWSEYGLGIDKWYVHRSIDRYNVTRYARDTGKLAPVEIEFLLRYHTDDKQTFIACLAILLSRVKFKTW